jgi:hypothetical protein
MKSKTLGRPRKISRSAAKIDVSFIHERGKCVGNIHAACAPAFKKAASTNETSALYERNFLGS